jgi:hypothetical protein
VKLTLYGLSVQISGPSAASRLCGADVTVTFRDAGPLIREAEQSALECWYTSEWREADGRPGLQIYRLPAGDFWWRYGYGVDFLLDRAGARIEASWSVPATAEDASFYLLGPILGFVRRLRGATCLHGSAVALDGRAVILVGASGAGKSTTAAALARRGWAMLTDDVAPLIEQGGSFLVQPGLPRLLLLPEALRSLGGGLNGPAGLSPVWDKFALDPAAAGFAFCPQPLPLGAIYLLGDRQADAAAPTIEPVPGAASLVQLASNVFGFSVLSPAMRAEDFAHLGRVLGQVPVRLLRRPDDPRRLDEVCDAILADYRSLDISEPGTPVQGHV